MTSTKNGSQVGGYRTEVDQQKLGPALVIASSLILAIRTSRWPTTHSDALANMDWDKEVEHSVRLGRLVLSHLTTRHPDLFHSRQVPWYVATDEESPK